MTEFRIFGRISRKQEITLSILSDPQTSEFYLKGKKHFATEPSLIWKLKWGRIHCSSIQDVVIGCNHQKCAFSSFSEFVKFQLPELAVSVLATVNPPWITNLFYTGTGGCDILSQSEIQVSNAKISHLALKHLAVVTVRQHYCRRWIAITTTHELPTIRAGFTLITGGNAAWHLCNFTYSLSEMLGQATSKNQLEVLVVEKLNFIPHQ